MRWPALTLVVALVACGQPGQPAPSQTPSARPSADKSPIPVARRTCPEWHPKEDGEDYGLTLTKPLPIPKAFRDVASASTTVMTVQSLAGTPICVRLGWIDQADDFTLSPDKRFFGFAHSGYETYGYRLVDRAGTGTEIETGIEPIFSKDRTLFASAEFSEASMGAFEALAVWQVGETDTVQLARVTDAMPDSYAPEEWTVTQVGPGRCVELSGLPSAMAATLAREGVNAQNRAARDGKGRDLFRFAPIEGRWKLVKIGEGAGAAACL